jgi:DNA-binding XRE family transcriptional regulator
VVCTPPAKQPNRTIFLCLLDTVLATRVPPALAPMSNGAESKERPSPEGVRIRRARLKARLTQEELARRAEVTTHTIWRLETEHRFNPRIQTLRAVAKALGVDVSHFLRPTRRNLPSA